jgi:hypothetical protein
MTSQIFLPVVKKYLKVAQIFGATHVEIEENGSIKMANSKRILYIYKIGTVLHRMYALAMCIHYMIGHLTPLEKLKGSMCLIVYTFSAIFRTGIKLENEPIQLVNMFLELEKQIYRGKLH